MHLRSSPDKILKILRSVEKNKSLEAYSTQELAGALKYITEFDQFSRKMLRRLITGQLYDEILDFVFDSFLQKISYDRIGVGLLEEENQVLRMVWGKSTGQINALPIYFSAPMKGSSLNDVLNSGKPRIIPNLIEYLAHKPNSDSTMRAIEDGIRSSLTCPLSIDGSPIGFVFFSSFTANTYSQSDVAHFLDVAEAIAVTVDYGRLRDFFRVNQSKEERIRMVMHDLRAPLSVIHGTLELAFEENWYSGLQKETKDTFQSLYGITNSMLELLTDLVNKSTAEQCKMTYKQEAVDLSDFLTEVRHTATVIGSRKGIAAEIIIEPNLPTFASFDPLRIRQIVDNLITNAIKFSPRGSRIQIQVNRDNRDLLICIFDSGPGIPEADIPKLFKRFGRTSVTPTEGESSSGLGLAIAKEILDEIKGSISLETSVGTGSIFRVRIPNVFPAGSVHCTRERNA